ncbi:hypothetical protein D3C84_1085780 [compost metagenome]
MGPHHGLAEAKNINLELMLNLRNGRLDALLNLLLRQPLHLIVACSRFEIDGGTLSLANAPFNPNG